MAKQKMPQDVLHSHTLRDRSRNEIQKTVLLREVAKIRQERLASLQEDLRELTQTIEKSSRKRSLVERRSSTRPKRKAS